jgi:hypothetical protein
MTHPVALLSCTGGETDFRNNDIVRMLRARPRCYKPSGCGSISLHDQDDAVYRRANAWANGSSSGSAVRCRVWPKFSSTGTSTRAAADSPVAAGLRGRSCKLASARIQPGTRSALSARRNDRLASRRSGFWAIDHRSFIRCLCTRPFPTPATRSDRLHRNPIPVRLCACWSLSN